MLFTNIVVALLILPQHTSSLKEICDRVQDNSRTRSSAIVLLVPVGYHCRLLTAMNNVVLQHLKSLSKTSSAFSRLKAPQTLNFNRVIKLQHSSQRHSVHTSAPSLSSTPRPIKDVKASDLKQLPRSKETISKKEDDMEIKGVSFSELGATKTVKVVVIVAVSIIATVETYTYGLWIYHRWFKKEIGQTEEGPSS